MKSTNIKTSYSAVVEHGVENKLSVLYHVENKQNGKTVRRRETDIRMHTCHSNIQTLLHVLEKNDKAIKQ